MKLPDITAHTGCMGTPDNTLESSLAGIKAGAGLIEVDIQSTRDGIAFLFHDELPIFLTSTFSELNHPELRQSLSPIYKDRELVTLEQLFEATMGTDIRYNLDLKTEEAAFPAIEVMELMGMTQRVFFTGNTQTIEHYRNRVVWNTPEEWGASLWMKNRELVKQKCDNLAQKGYFGLNMDYRTCCQELVDYAHEIGLAVWVYTVDDPANQKNIIQMGVDAITTRQVDTLRTLLEV
ncbi:glycerophosphodiester phosphodiesterase [Brevibacillus sp. Leaf182]|uniref:glycerophosphodiester phosphodiesterase n=1 Tax=Brevibacillus sp. Leaf182 TaxID=1736290 RepID=UPI0006F82781|nr:glycerophosphodiester phosphodiesterase [Brevibacillus sp. Leaf182]RAT99537.1 glycerophosphodiester phosphodiesterase [Brevibacillus sp. Leaf182]